MVHVAVIIVVVVVVVVEPRSNGEDTGCAHHLKTQRTINDSNCSITVTRSRFSADILSLTGHAVCRLMMLMMAAWGVGVYCWKHYIHPFHHQSLLSISFARALSLSFRVMPN
uniref:Putative secreted protein n=1 Tax=Anopheles darlingi TaxID=43151 RepID=A0A2M4DC89_ANODA